SRLRQRADAGRAPRSGSVGGAVSAGVHLARMAREARILERRSLISAAGAHRGRLPRYRVCGRAQTSGTPVSRNLVSAPPTPWSHRTRIVLAEKGISIDIVSVEAGRFPEDLLDLNPYHSVPTLVDRDLVLYDSRVIIEYLDERFPHPPLMPVDPVT